MRINYAWSCQLLSVGWSKKCNNIALIPEQTRKHCFHNQYVSEFVGKRFCFLGNKFVSATIFPGVGKQGHIDGKQCPATMFPSLPGAWVQFPVGIPACAWLGHINPIRISSHRAQYREWTVGSLAVQCGVLCLCRFMQFTGYDQPVQHSYWPENAIDWLR